MPEAARAKALRDGYKDTSELDALMRLEGLASRSVRILNLPKSASPKAQTLQEYLAQRVTKAPATPGEAA